MRAEISQLPADDINIRAIRGDTLILPFDFNANLTGYTFTFTCERASSTVHVNLPAGRIQVTFDTTIATGSYSWELKWATPGGSIRTLFRGTLEIM